ncbi:DUF6350 family protein [Agrococcus beijingensis]|uniref:cell division protein PerM n=1 Tax=Agrococcus beijingensis TaxID=3068634 RepID=UPI0027415CCA|nr:DUF6350 family protein [Agrococcus sp. REN33]
MRRVWAGFGQAVESAAIAVVGLVLCALVLLAVWGIDQDFAGDPLLQWRVAVDAWMLGHGVDLRVELGSDAVIALGLEAASRPFVITLGAWGIGLLTFWLHWRSGSRVAELPTIDAAVATVCGAVATGLVGLLAAVSAQHPNASPDLVQAFALPALVALLGMTSAILRVHGHAWLHLAARALTVESRWLRPIRAALRTGLGGAVAVLGVGGLIVGLGLLVRFTDGLLLMESLEVTHLGVVVLFLLQLALAPVAVVWAASWAIGPGFMLGAGSSVSPLGTDLGPVPALPLLAAIDPAAAPWMLIVVALPVLAAVVVGAFARQTILAGTTDEPVHWWELAIAGVGGGVLAGALLGVAAMLASGAMGPGRLDEAGPDAVLVAAWGALEVAVGLVIGLTAGGRGAGELAGVASPLAAEGEGSSMRDFFGLGASREAGADADDEGADASGRVLDADHPTEAVAPLPGEQPTEAVAPLPGEQPTEAVDPLPGGTAPVVTVSAEDRTITQAVDPLPAAAGDAAAGDPDASDDQAEPASVGEPTHPTPDDPERTQK